MGWLTEVIDSLLKLFAHGLGHGRMRGLGGLLAEANRLLANQVHDFVGVEDCIAVILGLQVRSDCLPQVGEEGSLVDCMLAGCRLLLQGLELHWLVALGVGVLWPLVGKALGDVLSAH